MRRTIALSFVVVGLLPAVGSSLEIKNFRLTYGPGGATRVDNQFAAKDMQFISFEVDGLTLDDDGKANFETILKLYDQRNTELFDRMREQTVSMKYGHSVPVELEFCAGWRGASFGGREREPGNYVIRIIVRDKLSKELKFIDQVKYIDHRIKVLQKDFAMVNVKAAATADLQKTYTIGFSLINTKLGKDGRERDAEVVIRVLGESGEEITKEVRNLTKLAKKEYDSTEDVEFAVRHTKVGRFIVEMEGHDRLGDKQAKLRFPLQVIDAAKDKQ